MVSILLDIKYEMHSDLLVSLRGWILSIDPVVLEALIVLKLLHLQQLGSILPLKVAIPDVESESLIIGMWYRVSKLVVRCSLERLHLCSLNKME